MDAAVQRAERRMAQVSGDADHELVRRHFDVWHYLLQAPELSDDPDVDLVDHFLTEGEQRGLSPHPDFSVAEYRRRHPRKAADPTERSPYLVWLKRGRAEGDVGDPAPRVGRFAATLGRDLHETVDLVVARRDDLQRRLRRGRLGEMFAEAAELEPLIGDAWQEATAPKLLPLSQPAVVEEMHVLHRAHQAAGHRRARVVIVINRGRWGGGRRMEGHLAHALCTRIAPEEIVVIHTEESGATPPGRYPDGVRVVEFADLARALPHEAALHALTILLRTFRADAVVNINSRTLHHAMRTYGRALAASERVFPVFFCHEQSGLGTWRGWGLRYFYRAFDDSAGVITDSRALRDELISRHQVPASRRDHVHALAAPVDPAIPLSPTPGRSRSRRPQVFWSGRWDRQKRVGLLHEIARQMPEVDFRMWGEAVMTRDHEQAPDNVRAQGRYDAFADLPLHEADLWLYTSGWDGVPSLLLEVAMTGIPLVGTAVGGTVEVLREGWARPVPVEADAAAYVREIRAVLEDPEAAREGARRLREQLVVERSAERFAQTVLPLLLLPDGRGDE